MVETANPNDPATGSAAAIRHPGPEIVGLACPECDEEAIERVPATLVPYELHGLVQPEYSHRDGEPLCPVMGPHGYQPADPIEVHAPSDIEPATAAAIAHAHTATSCLPDPGSAAGDDLAVDRNEGREIAAAAEFEGDPDDGWELQR